MLFNATEKLDICFGEGLSDEVYFCSLKENSLKIRTYSKKRKQVILHKHFKWLNEGGLGFGTRPLEIDKNVFFFLKILGN